MSTQIRRYADGDRQHPVRALLILLAALLPVLGLLVVAPAANAADSTPKISFCHATSSNENPYNAITTDAASIIQQGHDTHLGPVWSPGLSGPAKDWGDVIPAFDWVDKDGATQHFAGLNTDRLDVIANDCVVPPVRVELAAPVAVDQTCDAPGTITIEARTGVTWTLDSVATDPGKHEVAAGNHVVTATAQDGYAIAGQSTWTLTVAAATGCTVVTVTPVSPTVVPSSACGAQGSVTVPATVGVQYLLDGVEITAGEHAGPVKGTMTAVALTGYRLADPTWSFPLEVAAAEACPAIVVVTPVAPTVTQSSACDAEGSYEIPSTTGVQYLRDGAPIAAGTYDGPASGTITAKAVGGATLSDPGWSYSLDVAAAETCSLPSTGGEEPATGATLPQTGGNTAPMAGLAALLLALGAGLVVATTRRPTTR